MKSARLILLLLCCSLSPLVQGQESRWASRTWQKITGPNKTYDTTYIYHLNTPWCVSFNADLIWNDMSLQSESSVLGDPDSDVLHINHRLACNFFQKVGFGASVGSVYASYLIEIKQAGSRRNRYLNLSLVRPRLGVSMQYYNIFEFLHTSYFFNGAPERVYDVPSQVPGHLRHLVVDAFYFFNPSGFSYDAVRGRNHIQVRSGGSWMALARYSLEDFRYDPKDPVVLEFFDHIGQYLTGAVSLGGGYSFNWVPLSRLPDQEKDKGLRNLTVNLTLLPYVSLYNHIQTTEYKSTGPGSASVPAKPHQGFLHPTLNFTARAGFSFSWDRFCLCATANLNRLGFRGLETVSPDEFQHQRIVTRTRGDFYDITTRIQFNVRF